MLRRILTTSSDLPELQQVGGDISQPEAKRILDTCVACYTPAMEQHQAHDSYGIALSTGTELHVTHNRKFQRESPKTRSKQTPVRSGVP